MEPEDKPGGAGGTSSTADGVGKKLKAAREKAGLTVQDVAERTRVPARHLTAIEDGRFQDLPALAYSAGFARSYAQAVGLDGAEVAAQYRAEATPDPLPYYDQYEPLDPARVPSSGLAWIAAAVGAVIVALLIAFSMGVFSRDGDNVTTVAATPEPAPAPAPIPQTDDQVEDQGGVETQGPQVAASSSANVSGQPVVLTASDDAWIKVYDKGGQTVRMGILKAGEAYAVPGDPNQLLLWTGKAGAVKITVGGKAVAPLGQPVQTVRDISLAPASLLARTTPAATAGSSAARQD
jgi:cytoskeletal protein RodZ